MPKPRFRHPLMAQSPEIGLLVASMPRRERCQPVSADDIRDIIEIADRPRRLLHLFDDQNR